MSETTLSQYIWAVPALFIILAAWQGFNRPPTNRAGTTFALFCFGLLAYFALLMAIWGVVIVGLVKSGQALFLDDLKKNFNASESMVSFVLTLIAAMMVALASQFRAVRRLDAAAREFCLELAVIPRFADQLGMELASSADFHVNERLRTPVSQLISNNIGSKALNFKMMAPRRHALRALFPYTGSLWRHTTMEARSTFRQAPPADLAIPGSCNFNKISSHRRTIITPA